MNKILTPFSIYASFNDTFVHVTDLTGKETIVRVTGKCPLQSDSYCSGVRNSTNFFRWYEGQG